MPVATKAKAATKKKTATKKTKLTKEQKKFLLSDVAPEKQFWVHDGPVLKSLADLSSALKEMSDDTFSYHLNASKNDFANWIKDVIEDTDLTSSIARVKTKKSFEKKIEERLAELEA